MIDLSGYTFEKLREDREFIVSRGRRKGDPASVLLLAAASEHPSRSGMDQINHVYSLRNDLDSSWAIRPIDLVDSRGIPALLLNDPGGDFLDGVIGRPVALIEFLRLAIGMAKALGHLHARGLIHRNVKPANVIVNIATGEAWLTGFGLTSRLPRQRQPPEPPEVIAGTLAYMAPEQTGRMNRSVDSRSDLYSLGVTLYEMFVGGLPFTASEPMEWIHCHIARLPAAPSLRRSEIPEPISAIILKLLAKAPEERYQTATGVEADLRRCLSSLEAHGRIELFPLGARDVPNRLIVQEKLYGREREVELLLAAFDRVVGQSTKELVLVSGYSGVGKSSVVNELHKALVPPRGLFAFGKFDQYKRDIPYATLAQAFQSLVRQILGKSDAEIAAWRKAFEEALGMNGQLMASLIPELELVMGKQPPVAELPARDAQNRFQMVFRRLLGVFARPEHPLALFLDDLQWLDAATLNLLEHLITHDEVRHLLLIGAYRDNEVSPSHPLMRTLAEIRKAGVPVHQIALAPLGLDEVGQLVADALHCERKRAQSLAQIVHEKTDGNPFFTIQFIAELEEEGLLAFAPDAAVWMWDVDRIRAKGYTDNVVDLMVGKLNRLPETTQDSLKQLACLGNSAEIAVLSMVFGESEERLDAALWEAVRAGLVSRSVDTYTFVHDRVHEAAYVLIPVDARATEHLRIGRLLSSRTAVDEIEEKVFEIVNQLNRASVLITSQEEREQVAEFNLIAGKRAKRSTAYASALNYLSTGGALLTEESWARRYALTFELKLQQAVCEMLNANLPAAEQLILELLQRAKTKVDSAAAYRLKVELHIIQSQNNLAMESALEGLRLFDLRMSLHPDRMELDAAVDDVWRVLAGREIETLIDLPLVTDPEVEATLGILCALYAPAFFTDENLTGLQICHTIRLTLEHGITGASAHAFGLFGNLLGHFYGRYVEGSRFAQFAVDLGRKHRLLPFEAKILKAKEEAIIWTHPVTDALDSIRAASRAANQSGDISVACYACNHAVSDLLLRGDHLNDVWDETERGLAFVREAKYRDGVDILVAQQRFIQNMRGRTASFSTFDDDKFDQASFEKQLTPQRMTAMVCWYWIIKGQARFISGDFNEATNALERARPILWASHGRIQYLDYHLYSALSLAAGMPPGGGLPEQREQLSAHCRYLALWAETYPPTFADKHLLVTAEIARVEGRDLDAERLYEAAIRAAHENGFVQHEGLANEIAARFYAARGFEKFAHVYLRDARNCYLRWGADGKVRQLDKLFPHLREERPVSGPTGTIGASVEQLDLTTVIKVSQAVSSEIDLEKLINILMRTAIEHAGAERGLLIFPQGDQLRIEAEATTSGDSIIVQLREASVTAAELPDSIVHYVARTRENVILDDASAQNPFCLDTYIRQHHARSVLCLPLLKQAKLIGVLYLENNLTLGVFTPARVAVLKMLASEAAISLENTRLYGEIKLREARIRRLVEANIMGIVIWDLDGRVIDANDSYLQLVNYSREDIVSGRVRWRDLTPVEWRDRDEQALAEIKATGEFRPFEKEFFRKDGSRLPVLIGGAIFEAKGTEGVAFILDLSEQKRAETALRSAQVQLAHVSRVTTLGELTASIAHEVNQPLGAVVNNANACLSILSNGATQLEEIRDALNEIIEGADRASAVVSRVRQLSKKVPYEPMVLDIRDVVTDVLALARLEAATRQVTVRTDLTDELPSILGDRVQLQQVLLNLVVNGMDAMTTIEVSKRILIIAGRCEKRDGETRCLLSVQDAGTGFKPEEKDRLFEAFYTTKAEGMGMGLAISRSIIEAHGGRLWAETNEGKGATFQFSLPNAHPDKL